MLQQFSRACGLQWINANLSVIGFVRPVMTITGSIIDEEQNSSHRQTFDQTIEESLRFIVNPMEVLKNDEQRLLETFTDQHSLERVESIPPLLLEIHIVKSFDCLNKVVSFH